METNNKYFRKGSRVEVWSLEDGFQNAWFPAVIVQPPPSVTTYRPSPKKRKLPKDDTSKAVVIYDHMLSDDGKQPLIEQVPAFLLRPVPPSGAAADPRGFEPNDVVDAFYNDIWWTGIVQKVADDGDQYTVFFKNPPDVLEFHSSELRPHWDWEEPKWVRPEKQAIPEAIFRPGTAVEADLNPENPGFNWVPVVFLGEVGKDFVVVKYKKSTNNGESEKVTVHVQQIRPQPPEMNDTNFDLLDKVDAFCNLSWSVGVITKILSERRYVVTFRLEKKEEEFNHSEVRPHLDWIDGRWVTNSGEVLFTPGCEEQSNHACNTGRNSESSTLNETSGSTMKDTETGTPCSPNKQDSQKVLSPCVDESAYFKSSNKEIVNHTSNGDESAEVIMITDDEGIELSKRPLKTPPREVGEGKDEAMISVRKRGRPQKSNFKIPWPKTPKRGRSSKLKLKYLQSSVAVRGDSVLKIADDKDIFEPKYVIEELKVSGLLVEPKGVRGSVIENSSLLPIEGEKNDVGASSKLMGKGQQPELLVANLQAAEAGEELGGSGGVVPECATDKPSSPVTTRVELTDQPEDVQTIASASTIIVSADKALSMQVEETLSLTNVDESDTPEDGRALVSPTSIDVVSTGKAFSMQIEETPEDGRALVSPTSLNIVSTGKALSMQIEETPEDGRALVSSTSLNIVSTDNALSTQIEETPEDGRALVSPTSLNILSTGKALSTEIEETPEDGRALVSPTSLNIVSTGKALSTQIEETPEDGRALVSSMSLNIVSTDNALSTQIEKTPEDERAQVSATCLDIVSIDKAVSMQIEVTPEDGRALVSPTCTNAVHTDHQALSMLIEETPEDGRALVSPTSTNVVPTDQALSMQIEEKPVHGRALVPPTSTNVFSADKALSMQNVGTSLTDIDESGNIEQEDIQNFPFVRSSSIWKLIESMEVFKKLPQKPHFHPLVKCEEIKREASAMMNMLNFAYLIEKTLKLQEDDSREHFGIIMEELANLEELGFNVKVVHDHIYEKLQKKVKLEELQDESKGFEIQIAEHTDKKTKIDGEVAKIDKEIERLKEKQAMLMSKSAEEGSKISKLLAEVAVIREAISSIKSKFQIETDSFLGD